MKKLKHLKEFKHVAFVCLLLLLMAVRCNPEPEPDPIGGGSSNSKTASLVDGTTIKITDEYNNSIGSIGYRATNSKATGYFLYGAVYSGYYQSVSVCDVGVVSGLSAMNSVPQTGFTPASDETLVNCIPTHGYIFKFTNQNYGEEYFVFLYVVNYITDENQEIIGCKVNYKIQINDIFYF